MKKNRHGPPLEEKETIHSGQFMVSHFEAEEQDDEDEVAVPVPEEPHLKEAVIPVSQFNQETRKVLRKTISQQQLEIDTSLSKLFHCMSLAYRQKLTSPKWNRFRGIRLRWKEKIRLNNVIWRCWHLQFIKKANTLLCQFASPLEVDIHNKPEAVVLEGKYWKRKLAACTAEYKKWRMFYRNHSSGHVSKDLPEMLTDVELLILDPMTVDEDYMGFMSDTLFSTITNQPFAFPDSREIAKAGYADFIQPSLGPLQPNLEDYMDTMEPLQDLLSYKLPVVLEEQGNEINYKYCSLNYPEDDAATLNKSSQQPTEEERVHGSDASPKQPSRSSTGESIKKLPSVLSSLSDPSDVRSCNLLLTKLLPAKPDNSQNALKEDSTCDLVSTQHIKKEESLSGVIVTQLSPASSTSDIFNATTDAPSDMVLNSLSSSSSPIFDNNVQSVSSPSSHSSLGSPNRDGSKDFRSKTCHLQSEQKRRISIKNGFDTLYSLIPQINKNSATKLSKAAMLQKGAEYIRQLKIERDQVKAEMDQLRQQIDALSSSISNCQTMLPATGAPISRGRDDKLQEMYDKYVKERTTEDWKFWIFSLLFRPLLTSFNNIVSTSSLDDLYRSTLLWIEQHCTLRELRPVVLTSLRYLSIKTEVLNEPEKLPEEVQKKCLTPGFDKWH